MIRQVFANHLAQFIIKRLLQLVPVFFGITLITFVLIHVTPGDPTAGLPGAQRLDPRAKEMLYKKMGLDDPYHVQYFRYVKNVVCGDFGMSSHMVGRPVGGMILKSFGVTLQLAALAILFSIVFGVLVGVVAALRPYSIFDLLSMVGAIAGVSIPAFFLAMLLILLFAVTLSWFPISGYEAGSIRHLILPAVALGLIQTAVTARITRSAMLDVLGSDYIRTARAKGVRKADVVFSHALKNAALPIVTVIGANFGSLLTGAVLTETVFGLPGLGSQIVKAIGTRDHPMVMGGVVFMACVFVLVNLVVDISYAFIDPRVKYGGGKES